MLQYTFKKTWLNEDNARNVGLKTTDISPSLAKRAHPFGLVFTEPDVHPSQHLIFRDSDWVSTTWQRTGGHPRVLEDQALTRESSSIGSMSNGWGAWVWRGNPNAASVISELDCRIGHGEGHLTGLPYTHGYQYAGRYDVWLSRREDEVLDVTWWWPWSKKLLTGLSHFDKDSANSRTWNSSNPSAKAW